ncbi:restriction endonuclease subunit S [Caloramator sp. CAR-1]|uniref:restriction endonuclease subunit S n=1 Tax=Caloramator sp. CAR-1 TaxID=3062777 RepID=UPI0026E45837|nr:restriction endonuclease subunit S [Caloramator sp. CAR-1]MDO6355758.1 restriction endonuclease subunit S [Caloramator sp. CAR-1]
MKYKRYERYKDCGVEWIGEIPEHWEVKKLKYLTNCLDGKRIPLSSEQRGKMQGDIPYWGANGIIDYVNDWIINEEVVLLGEDGAPFFDKTKDVAFYSNEKIWPNNHIHVLKTSQLISAKLLTYILNTVDYGNYINGSTRDKLTQSDMKNIFIQLPPENEQSAIVNFLDQKTSEIESLIKDKEKLIILVEEKRQAIITEAVTKGLNPNVKMKNSGVEWIGEIPEHWEVIPLKYLTKFVSRGDSPDYVEESSIRVINQACIYWDDIKIENIKFQDDSKKDINDFKGMLKYGDLMMNSTGTGTLGRANIFKLKGNFIADSHVTIIRCKNELLNFNYLNYLLRTQVYQGYVYSSLINGATNQIELSRERLINTPIILPPIDEQKKIVEYLDMIKNLNVKLIEVIKLQIERLKEYRQSLIYEVVTGKIDVRDFNINN